MQESEQPSKKCSLCNGSGLVEMTLPLPFSAGEIVERTKEPCPVCSREKTKNPKQPNRKKTTKPPKPFPITCLKTQEKNVKMHGENTHPACAECEFYEYCRWRSLPKKIRPKLTRYVYRRSQCRFYIWQPHICLLKFIETNRAICAFCKEHEEKSKWQITFHLGIKYLSKISEKRSRTQVPKSLELHIKAFTITIYHDSSDNFG